MQNKLAETEVHAGHECHEQKDENKDADDPAHPFADGGGDDLAELVDGLARAVAGSPLTVEEVCELNRVLLTGTRLAERGGVIRAEQNWIGGNRGNPVGAAYVLPSSSWRSGRFRLCPAPPCARRPSATRPPARLRA